MVAKGQGQARALSPFEEVDRIFEEFDRMFDELVPAPRRQRLAWERPTLRHRAEQGWVPSADVMDGDEDIAVRAELPGVDKDVSGGHC